MRTLSFKLLRSVLIAVLWLPILVAGAGADSANMEPPVVSSFTSRETLWDNGPILTHPGGGAGGSDLSMLQSGLGMNSLGFNINMAADDRVADDFIVTSPWNITRITGFAYQTDSSTASTITDVYIQIWNGSPDASGAVIWGDLTTNVLTNGYWTGMYRAAEIDPSNASRPVMRLQCDVSIQLQPGKYWLDMSVLGSSTLSGPWLPPVTILGERTTGDALHNASGSWQDLIDSGSSTAQGMPFIIEGSTRASILTFDDITGAVGSQYPGYTFSPGYFVWDSSANPNYPQYSPPNVCYSHETDPSIEWDEQAFFLSFFINCAEISGNSYVFRLFDGDDNVLDTYTTDYALNRLLVFREPGMQRLAVSGTGDWNERHTIDHVSVIHGIFPECPPDSLFSQPHDVHHPELNAFNSDADGPFIGYESYSIPHGNAITGLRWWGVNSGSNPSSFTVNFRADASGVPGDLVSTFTVTPDSIETGLALSVFEVIMYTADLPEPETQASGWISIVGPADGSYFYWADSTFGDEFCYQLNDPSLVGIEDDLAVCLTGGTLPTPTPTGSVPTATPTPECSSTGCEVVMPSHDFGEGDTCYCDVYVCNMDGSPLTENPLFVILDVYGAYFFAPSFSAFDYYSDPIPAGMSTISVLPSFAWPSGAGTASGLFWYAAMTDPGITTLYGGLGSFEFGWH